MNDSMIGTLMTLPVKRWVKFKEKHPQYFDKLDYAVVKELDDKYVLIEKERIYLVLNDCI